jgi:hypothetical protein
MKSITFLILCFGLCGRFACKGDFVLSPVAAGNSDNLLPFVFPQEGNSMRYQQVYGASDFSALQPGGGLITDLSFRLRTVQPGLSVIISNIQVDLSTTPKSPDSLSPVFAQNVGLDDRVFYSGVLSLNSAGGGNFDITIHGGSPFYYNPALGNLLLDVRNYTGARISVFGSLLAEYTVGDTVSKIYAYNVGASAADGVDTGGLVTLFTVTPVPEPSMLHLLLLAAPLLAWRAWHRKRKKGTNEPC